MNQINPDKDVLLIEHHWELVVMVHSYNLQGPDGQLKAFADIYKKVSENPKCPCNKNSIAYLDNIKNNLNKFLKPEEIEKIKNEETVKIVHVKKSDGSILEF
jgi:hypothetical protein